MSYDGKVPPGGVSPNTGAQPRRQSEQRRVTGKFKASSGLDREVSASEGRTHIPPATDNVPKDRPLDDWDVSIRGIEQLFFSKVADLLTTEESTVKQELLREELKALHTCMSDLLTQYNQRINELAADDRIMEKDFRRIQGPMIRVFQTVQIELAKLEKALLPNASKSTSKDAKDVLAIAKNQIEQANKVLTEAKALLVESTIPKLPEAPELPKVKVHPVPGPVSKKKEVQEKEAPKKRSQPGKKIEPDRKTPVEAASAEQRLKDLTLRLQKSSTEDAQVTLQHIVSVLEKLGHQLEEHIQESPDDLGKKAKKAQFDDFLGKIRSKSQEKIRSDEIASLRSQIKDHVFICEMCIKGITGWQGNVVHKVTPLAPSEIYAPPLRKQYEVLAAATSTRDKQEALKKVGRYIYDRYIRFNQLLPLINTVAIKSDFESQDPPAECTDFYTSIGLLEKAMKVIVKGELNKSYHTAIKEADKALSVLEKFDQQLPASFWQTLTRTTAQPGQAAPHFINLMCRRILNEETGPLSKRASLKKFADISTCLEKIRAAKVGKNTVSEISQALREVVTDEFSSLEKIRSLMAQAHTLEEVHAIAFQLENWTDREDNYLDRVCVKLDHVAEDLELELERKLRLKMLPEPEFRQKLEEARQELKAISNGRDALRLLASQFTPGTQAAADKESAERLSLLEAEIKAAVEKIVQERLDSPDFFKQIRSSDEVCTALQKELSEELGNVATIVLEPGKSKKEVLSRVIVKLGNAEQDIEKINATISGKGKHANRLRQLLLASDARKVLETDAGQQTCRWEAHPRAMIHQFAGDFVNNFEQYERGVHLARQHEQHINRLVVARGQVDDGLKSLEAAIPKVAQLRRKIKKRSRRRLLDNNLNKLKTKVARLKGRHLERLTEEAKPVRKLVLDMLKQQQLTTNEAIKLLDPLYRVEQSAMGKARTLPMKTEPSSSTGTSKTQTLEMTLNDFQKKYRQGNIWHLLTRKKRMEAVKMARSLVEICEACPHAPISNAQMLDDFVSELKKIKNPHPDYKQLIKGLNEYADDLQRRSVIRG